MKGKFYRTRCWIFNYKTQKAADKGPINWVLFVDLSKAFDTLRYCELITKVQSCGIKGHALPWFTDYLFARHQVAKFNNKHQKNFLSQVEYLTDRFYKQFFYPFLTVFKIIWILANQYKLLMTHLFTILENP